MTCIVSICEDVTALTTDFPELMVDGDGKRTSLISWSGGNTYYNGNKSIKVLTDATGLEAVAAHSSVTSTTYEAIFGTDSTAADVAMRTLYDSVYDQTPQTIDGVLFTPPKLVAVPSGWDSSHLTL